MDASARIRPLHWNWIFGGDLIPHSTKKDKQSGVLITFNSKTTCLQFIMYFKVQLTDAPLR